MIGNLRYKKNMLGLLTILSVTSLIQNDSEVIFATDDFFAEAENLLKVEEPITNNKNTVAGKWMDGWETRRKRIAGHDWAIIHLKQPGIIRNACFDVSFFVGNYAPFISLQASFAYNDIDKFQNRRNKLGTEATEAELEKARSLRTESWETILPLTPLKNVALSNSSNYRCYHIDSNYIFNYVRLNLLPDGGIARLRLYGELVEIDKSKIDESQISGKCVGYSNGYFSNPNNLLKLTKSNSMNDGWETARQAQRPHTLSLDSNGFMEGNASDWAIYQLDETVIIYNVEVDTSHFKGNYPDSAQVDGAFIDSNEKIDSAVWKPIIPRTKARSNQRNGLLNPWLYISNESMNYIRVTIAPDGGLARVRVFGFKV